MICASFCEKCFLILQFLWKCAPRSRWEAHFRRTIFASIACKTKFPYPYLLQNLHFSGGISALCCSKNDNFRRLSGKWLSWEAQFGITIDSACIWDRMFIILRLILLQFVQTHFPSSLRNIAPSGRPSPPGMRHVLAPSHMPIHTLQKSTRTIPPCNGSSSAARSSVVWEGLWTMACSLYFYWGLDMSYAFQQDVVLLLSPILHRMLLFANLHPECRNKYRRAAVVPSPECLKLNK